MNITIPRPTNKKIVQKYIVKDQHRNISSTHKKYLTTKESIKES